MIQKTLIDTWGEIKEMAIVGCVSADSELVLCDDIALTHCQQILKVLSDGNFHHRRQIVKVGGHRYGARIYQLRKGLYDGNYYDIKTLKKNRLDTYYKLCGVKNIE